MSTPTLQAEAEALQRAMKNNIYMPKKPKKSSLTPKDIEKQVKENYAHILSSFFFHNGSKWNGPVSQLFWLTNALGLEIKLVPKDEDES